MPVTFLTTEDSKVLETAILKLNQRADLLDGSTRDLSFYVHKELGPILERLNEKLNYLDAQEEENHFLKSKKYKAQIIKEYTDSLVTQNR